MNTLIQQLDECSARELCNKIKQQASNLCELFRRLHDGKGWIALGYETWSECCEKEFRYTKRHVNHLLQMDGIKRQLGENLPLTDAQARELRKVPADQREAVVEWAKEKAGAKQPTAAMIRHAAEEFADAEPDDEEDDDDDSSMEARTDETDENTEAVEDDPPKVSAKDWLTEAVDDLVAVCENAEIVAQFLDGLAELVGKTDRAVMVAKLENLATKLRR